MKFNRNFSKSDFITTNYDRPPAGVYVCRIVDVVDNEEKEYLRLTLDINEGIYKNYGADMLAKFGNAYSYIPCYISYKDTASDMLRKKILIIAKSNGIGLNKDTFENDLTSFYNKIEKTSGKSLKGLLVGIVIGHQEYKGKNGKIYLKWDFPYLITVQDAREKAGNFRIPPIKRITDNEDIPL